MIRNFIIAATVVYAAAYGAIAYMRPSGSVSADYNMETLSALPEVKSSLLVSEVVKAAEPTAPVFVDDSKTLRDMDALQRECGAIRMEMQPGDNSCMPEAVSGWVKASGGISR